MPPAIEQFDLSQYDIVLSDSSSYAKGAITPPETLHVCYCHTPMRYAWDDCQKYIAEFGFPYPIKKIIPFIMNYVRVWDRISAERVDDFIANSKFVSKRIKKYYRRDSHVINPPVNIENFYISREPKKHFLMVGRLMTYKRFDIVVEAFNRLGWPLKVIGRGPELKRLQRMAKPNILFTGRLTEAELARAYAEARAFIFPQEEDFGIVAIEAMASGVPIIAFKGGDIVEHVCEGKEGLFFDEQTPEALIKALKDFCEDDYDPDVIRQGSLLFDREIFKSKIRNYVEKQYENHRKGLGMNQTHAVDNGDNYYSSKSGTEGILQNI
jgi:glycosyltransferase involved in cell wall biosynthesis